MTTADAELADAMLLTMLPGWTWPDLQATPARVVDALRIIAHERAR